MNAVIATTPQGMIAAQGTMVAWVANRIIEAKRELSSAEQTYNALERAKLRVQPAQSQIRRARARITFYEKVKAALDAGYYIIPPFDVQLFAVRTNRNQPAENCSTSKWTEGQTPPALPANQGAYVNPLPVRELLLTETDRDGKPRQVTYYENTKWSDLEMPLRALKPELIEATAKAFGLRIFDALGIAPSYRRADPIIVGQIRKPGSRASLTFFVAWWLDERDL